MGPKPLAAKQIHPVTPEVGIADKMGGYEARRRKLQDERKREYNNAMGQVGTSYNNEFK